MFDPSKKIVEIYKKHGADEDLAAAMQLIFDPLTYAPETDGTIYDRLKGLTTVRDFSERALELLLVSKLGGAEVFLEAAQHEIPETYYYRDCYQIILDNLPTIQEVIIKSRDEVDKLRDELGLPKFEDCLKPYS